MLRAKITKATLTILAVFFIASVSYSQEDRQATTYKVPGDSTVYTLAPTITYPANLIPVAGTSSAKPKTPEPISYFHLEFVIKTIDSGKVTSSRTYNMDANTDTAHHFSLQGMDYRNQTSFRTDIQEHQTAADNTRTRGQTSVDCSELTLVGVDSVSMWVTASISNSVPPMDASYSGSFNPLVPFGKPAIIFSTDGPAPNSKIQLEVTATPIHLNLPTKP